MKRRPIILKPRVIQCEVVDASIERFAKEVGPLIEDWRSIDIRVIASRLGDKWIYGVIKAVLDSSEPSAATRKDLPSIDGLVVAQERWDIERLPDFLQALSNHQLEFQGRTLLVENANTNPSMNYTFEGVSRRDAIQRLGINSYALYFQSWAGQPMIEGDLRLTIDTQLRLSDCPWDGMADLLTHFVGVSPNFVRSMPTKLVEVIAPVSAWIRDTALSEPNGVRIDVEKSPSLSSAELGVSSVAYVAEDKQVRIRAVDGVAEGQTHVLFKVMFPTAVQQVTAILTYHHLDIDRTELFGRPAKGINPRLAILWQDTLEEFLGLLKDDKDKFFEDRVALLFHILGLSPGYYGRMYQDNPDILAFPDSGDWVLNIECTTREIDLNNKLSKLATRTKLLTAAMPGLSVHPILVTRMRRVLVNETEKEKARSEGISVITADEFDVLLRMAIEGAEPSRLRDYILTLVPGSNRGIVLS